MANKKLKPYYDPVIKKRLAGIALPAKMKCDRCEKWRGTEQNFSQGQRDSARLAIDKQGIKARYKVRCTTCATGLVVEIECTVCLKTKGRNEFAKSQRTKPDVAKCYECIEKQLETDPINEEIYEGDLSKALVTPDFSNGREPEYFGQNSRSTNSMATSTSGGWDDDDDDDDDDDGGLNLVGAVNQMSLNHGSQSSNSLIEISDDVYSYSSRGGPGGPVRPTNSGYINNGYSSPGRNQSAMSTQSPSIASSSAYRSNISNTANGSDATRVGASGFAKVKAYKAKKPAPPPEEDDDWRSEDEKDNDSSDADSDTEI